MIAVEHAMVGRSVIHFLVSVCVGASKGNSRKIDWTDGGILRGGFLSPWAIRHRSLLVRKHRDVVLSARGLAQSHVDGVLVNVVGYS